MTSLHVIWGLPPRNKKSWLPQAIEYAIDTGGIIFYFYFVLYCIVQHFAIATIAEQERFVLLGAGAPIFLKKVTSAVACSFS